MQTNPAVEQSKIIRWSKSPLNQSKEERICRRAKSRKEVCPDYTDYTELHGCRCLCLSAAQWYRTERKSTRLRRCIKTL